MWTAGVLSLDDYLEDYQGVPNPEETKVAMFADRMFEQTFRPLVERRVMGQLGYLMGPNGMPIDQSGQQVDPRQVLAANGWQQAQQAQPQGAFQPGMQSQPETRMGGMGDLVAPGTMPLQGGRTPMGTG